MIQIECSPALFSPRLSHKVHSSLDSETESYVSHDYEES